MTRRRRPMSDAHTIATKLEEYLIVHIPAYTPKEES